MKTVVVVNRNFVAENVMVASKLDITKDCYCIGESNLVLEM